MNKVVTMLAIAFLSLVGNMAIAQEDPFIQDFLERLENSREYTLLVAQMMPEQSYNFRATAEEMTFAEQLLHIGFAMNWHGQTLIGENETPKWQDDILYKTKDKSKLQMIQIVNETFDNTIKTLKEFDPERLDEQLEYFGLQRSKRQIFLMLADHITHHRGQMLVYLRLKEIVPPRYVLYQ